MWSKWEERFRTFGAKRIEFQTYKQGGARERGIKTDPEKFSKWLTGQIPNNTDERQQFLGFAGYY